MFAAFGLDAGARRLRHLHADDRAVPLRGRGRVLAARRREPDAEGAREHLQGFLRGLVLRAVRDVQDRGRDARPRARRATRRSASIHETPLDRVSEESYFFRLSDYDEALLALYESRPDFVRPEARRNEVISFVRGGLARRLDQPSEVFGELGHPRARRPDAHRLHLVRRAHQLHHGARLGQRERGRPSWAKTSSRSSGPALHLHRQRHPAPARDLWPAMLMAAGVELPAGVVAHGMWLDPHGAQDVEDARQRDRARPAAAPLQRGRGALLPPARDVFRAGLQGRLRGHHRPLQQRSRQRPRQPRRAAR